MGPRLFQCNLYIYLVLALFLQNQNHISEGSPEKQNQQGIYMYMYLNTYTYMLIYICIYLLRHRYTHKHKHIYKEIYFKGLVHMSVKAGMPKICGSNLGTRVVLRPNSVVFGKPQFLLVRPAADQMRPTHMSEGNLLYSESDSCRCCPHLQNTFIAASGVWVHNWVL